MLKVIVLMGSMFSIALSVEAQQIPLSDEYSVTRGGRLYDKWYKINQTGVKPEGANPAYPDNGKYKGNKLNDFRCKECHGWDYKGKDGLYSKGKHYTGIDGVIAAKGKGDKSLQQILRDKNHRFNEKLLSKSDAGDLSNFIRKGVVDMDQYIAADGEPKGNMIKGQAYYQTICVGCHGVEGKDEDTAPPLGQLANKNPWEVLHKIRMGQPNSEMPALYALDPQISVDIVKYLRTLPKE